MLDRNKDLQPDPRRAASGFSWWIVPALDVWLLLDGHNILCASAGEAFSPLADWVIFPGDFAASYEKAATLAARDALSPFLTSLPEPGHGADLTGWLVRTAAVWLLLLRRPANYPLPGPIEHFEGIVATERWFAPLFTDLCITKTDQPVRIHADLPLIQAQPIPVDLPASTVFDNIRAHDAREPDDWAAYVCVLIDP